MNEFLLALWAMTAGHHQWEMPPKEAVAIVRPVQRPESARELSAGERRELQTALERMARCASATLRLDADSGWYLPEQNEAKSCVRLSAVNSLPEE